MRQIVVQINATRGQQQNNVAVLKTTKKEEEAATDDEEEDQGKQLFLLSFLSIF